MEALFWIILFFAAAVLIELFWSKKQKLNFYSLEEALSNICHGLGQTILNIGLKIPLFFVYSFCYKHFAFFEVERSFASDIVLLITIDFIYYWFHKLSHHSPLLWANHSVHHQAEKFNFTVGLRPPLFNEFFSFFIHIPAALLGFSPENYALLFIFHTSWQLFNHTRFIKKEIPFLNFIFVTPSHHRVHHGQNAQYINKNFGAIFSFWDRMFGTYEKEKESVLFGIPNHQLEYNPLVSNLAPLLGEKPLLKRPQALTNFFDSFPYTKQLTLFLFSLTIVLSLGFLKVGSDLGLPIFLFISLYLFSSIGLVGSSLDFLAKTK